MDGFNFFLTTAPGLRHHNWSPHSGDLEELVLALVWEYRIYASNRLLISVALSLLEERRVEHMVSKWVAAGELPPPIRSFDLAGLDSQDAAAYLAALARNMGHPHLVSSLRAHQGWNPPR